MVKAVLAKMQKWLTYTAHALVREIEGCSNDLMSFFTNKMFALEGPEDMAAAVVKAAWGPYYSND